MAPRGGGTLVLLVRVAPLLALLAVLGASAHPHVSVVRATQGVTHGRATPLDAHASRAGRAGGPLRLRGGGMFSCCLPLAAKEAPEMQSVVADGAKVVDGETRPRRNAKFPDTLLATPFFDKPQVNTPWAAFASAASSFPERNCLGKRAYLENGGRGDYEWESYAQVLAAAQVVGEGLHKACGVPRCGRVGIYSSNRPEWTTSMLAMWSQGMVNVPLYDSVGPDAVRFIINHASLPVIVCERSKLATLLEASKEAKALRHIILFEQVTEADQELVNSVRKDIRLHCFKTMAEPREGAGDAIPLSPHQPADLSTILYTSGTTGDPKGVLLSAQNQMASVAGCMFTDPTFDGKTLATSSYFDQAVYISYLPLAHSFELNMQLLMLTTASSIGFYQGDIRKLVASDIPALKPTVMAGVPRVYSRIYDKVMSGVEGKGAVIKALFSAAMGLTERSMQSGGGRSWLWDKIFFTKIQGVLGGKLKLLLSGAAPLGNDLHRFMRVCFDVPVVQGYGLTENAGAAVAMSPWLDTVGSVGAPVPCTEVKLVDVAEMEYTSHDRYPESAADFEKQVTFKGRFDPELAGRLVPRGEICLRGTNIMSGYYKLEAETAEVLDAKKWLHTGDIGQWNADGTLSIIDRKKNIFKLAQGEYVSPEACEIAIGASKYAGQVWVYGNSFENYVVAIVVPDQDVMKKWAKDNGKAGVSMQELVKDPEVKKMIMADLIATGKAAKLRGFELPKEIDFETTVNDLGQGFTVDQDTLTPTMKLRRPQLQRMYQKQIDVMYVKIKAMEVAAAKKAHV
mmetsp:Transcript_33854/g.80255  ORF Transcript_33854/g.80255 Transcript_33854/m.80255 type:complete len:794 (-) Transcript_33854:484-2865(-)